MKGRLGRFLRFGVFLWSGGGGTALAMVSRPISHAAGRTVQQLHRRPPPPLPPPTTTLVSRGEVVKTGLSGLVVAMIALSTPTSDAVAFDNKVSNKYDDRPKRRGPKPPDLGVLPRKDVAGEEYQGLKHCGAAPNCFVSTDDAEDDPDHNIPPWIWPKELGDDKEAAFKQLASTISSYQPGQSDVDGGGFKVVTNDPAGGYIYTQFESLKNGYIDDVEMAYVAAVGAAPGGERAVQIRSSSRIGYLDFGVNAKRLNYIAKDLRAKGWDAPGVEYKTHRNYVIQNELE